MVFLHCSETRAAPESRSWTAVNHGAQLFIACGGEDGTIVFFQSWGNWFCRQGANKRGPPALMLKRLANWKRTFCSFQKTESSISCLCASKRWESQSSIKRVVCVGLVQRTSPPKRPWCVKPRPGPCSHSRGQVIRISGWPVSGRACALHWWRL